jgi:Zn-dependent alcohol dehydrogenase
LEKFFAALLKRGKNEKIEWIMAEMTAAVLYGKQDLRLEQVAVPCPAAGELLVRVEVALTCGTDLKVYRRGYHARMLKPPIRFGHELAGTVEEVGPGVTAFRKGDRVVALNSAPCDACFFCLTMVPTRSLFVSRRESWRRIRCLSPMMSLLSTLL